MKCLGYSATTVNKLASSVPTLRPSIRASPSPSAGVQGIGLFDTQNTVCKRTTQEWRYAFDRLKLRFPTYRR